MKTRFTKASVALLGGAVLFSGSAWSMPPFGEPTVTRTETLKYRTTELATPEGAAQLYERLQAAAARVCREPGEALLERHQGASPPYASCMAEALDKAVQTIAMPMVSALHRRDGRVPGTAVASR